MGIKLDMSKAYDRVEWGFLKAVMEKLGFGQRWIQLISQCVSTVNYSVLFDGADLGPIVPQRGLRQGDPLSPYLFIMVLEGLSAMIRKEQSRGNIHGVVVSRGTPEVSHLFFADDSFLFCRANSFEVGIPKGNS